MQQESREGLHFLGPDGGMEDPERSDMQALHAETVLELQKTRSLLLLEHRISKDLQVPSRSSISVSRNAWPPTLFFIKKCFDLKRELDTVKERLETERAQVRMAMAEKDQVLSKRAFQIKTLQGKETPNVSSSNLHFVKRKIHFNGFCSEARLKDFAYSTKNRKGAVPIQYTWPASEQEVVQGVEDDVSCAPPRLGESLLELHIKVK